MSKVNFCLCLKILHKSLFRIVRDNGYSVGHFWKCYQCKWLHLGNAKFDCNCCSKDCLEPQLKEVSSHHIPNENHPPKQPLPNKAGREESVQRAWKHLARKTLVAWDQSHKICIPIDVLPPSSGLQRCKSCKVKTISAIFSGSNCKTSFGNLG